MQFEEALKQLRINDDKVTYELNSIIPTQSFQANVDMKQQCKSMYEKMSKIYDARDKAVTRCVKQVKEEVAELITMREKDRDDEKVLTQLRHAQTKLRLMQRELQVEEIIKGRSLKTFYERCRNVYTPPERPSVV